MVSEHIISGLLLFQVYISGLLFQVNILFQVSEHIIYY